MNKNNQLSPMHLTLKNRFMLYYLLEILYNTRYIISSLTEDKW